MSLNQRSLTSSQLAVTSPQMCFACPAVLAHMALLRNLNLLPTLKTRPLHIKTQISSFSSQVEDRVPLMPHLQTEEAWPEQNSGCPFGQSVCGPVSPHLVYFTRVYYPHEPWRHLMSDPWFKRLSPRGGHGNSLQFSCLENRMDRGAWWAPVHRVAQNQTWLKQLSTHTRRREWQCVMLQMDHRGD